MDKNYCTSDQKGFWLIIAHINDVSLRGTKLRDDRERKKEM